jgi:hypothetical protein
MKQAFVGIGLAPLLVSEGVLMEQFVALANTITFGPPWTPTGIRSTPDFIDFLIIPQLSPKASIAGLRHPLTSANLP